ncbi:hypothetical protein FRC07_008281, partial [Ceratobasidium sp. 392]
MESKAVTEALAPTHPTSAHSAAPPTTAPRHAQPEPQFVSTVLRPNHWEFEICDLDLWDRFSDIPDGLCKGFRIGAKSPVHNTITPQNHKSALEQPK